MNNDTINLLKECDSGCKMAVESIDQVLTFANDKWMIQLLEQYREQHEKIRKDVEKLLSESGEAGKEPGIMASSFSWITTEMKILIKDGDSQIAKIMMDGCNMGIQSISKYRNQYEKASKEASDYAKELVKTEERFMKDLEQFILG